jgi:kynurenine formamidase
MAAAPLLVAFALAPLAVVDLTHALAPTSPSWPGNVHLKVKVDADFTKGGYYARHFTAGEHSGTHVDAPAHFARGGATVDAIRPDDLRVEAVVVDVRAAVDKDPAYRVTPADLEAWERAHGAMPDHALVIAWTGWDARWPDEGRYRNADARGVLQIPGFSTAAVQWLLAHHPGFVGLGIDSLSIDAGPVTDFAAHKLLLGAGKYGVENLTHLGALPPRGATLTVAPLPLVGGSGAPARVLADVPPPR